MNELQRFVAGFIAAASMILSGLGGLTLYANIIRPEESPEQTAHLIRVASLMTVVGLAGAMGCGWWYLSLLRVRLQRHRNEQERSANQQVHRTP